jgi:hypothetical protein
MGNRDSLFLIFGIAHPLDCTFSWRNFSLALFPKTYNFALHGFGATKKKCVHLCHYLKIILHTKLLRHTSLLGYNVLDKCRWQFQFCLVCLFCVYGFFVFTLAFLYLETNFYLLSSYFAISICVWKSFYFFLMHSFHHQTSFAYNVKMSCFRRCCRYRQLKITSHTLIHTQVWKITIWWRV